MLTPTKTQTTLYDTNGKIVSIVKTKEESLDLKPRYKRHRKE